MPRIYKLSRSGARLIYKIRHHRGHGIHSPFVFNLINRVIEEKTPFYAYQDIQDFLDQFQNPKLILKKEEKLIFRLANYFNARQILDIGVGSGLNSICMTAPSCKAHCTSIALSEQEAQNAQIIYSKWNRKIELYSFNIPQIKDKQDFIYIDLGKCESLDDIDLQKILALTHDQSCVVVKGIRTKKRHRMLWKNMIANENRTAVLDLFNLGIIFFDKKLYRWEYQISF